MPHIRTGLRVFKSKTNMPESVGSEAGWLPIKSALLILVDIGCRVCKIGLLTISLLSLLNSWKIESSWKFQYTSVTTVQKSCTYINKTDRIPLSGQCLLCSQINNRTAISDSLSLSLCVCVILPHPPLSNSLSRSLRNRCLVGGERSCICGPQCLRHAGNHSHIITIKATSMWHIWYVKTSVMTS